MPKSIFNRIGVAMAACVAIGVIALTGCGGGSSSSTTGASGASGTAGATPLSQDEFVSQANAVCKDSNAKIIALKAPESTLTAAAATLAQEIPIIGEAITKLSAITPPSDTQSQYSQWLAETKAQVALASQLETAAKANDIAKAQALAQKLTSTNDKINAAAKDMGLTECAKHASPQG